MQPSARPGILFLKLPATILQIFAQRVGDLWTNSVSCQSQHLGGHEGSRLLIAADAEQAAQLSRQNRPWQ